MFLLLSTPRIVEFSVTSLLPSPSLIAG